MKHSKCKLCGRYFENKPWHEGLETQVNMKCLCFLKAIKDIRPMYYSAITLRLGLEDGIKHTLEDVGKRLGVTRERIRQIEAKVLETLKGVYEH